jgi:ribosome maturation factor RimP
MNTDQVAALVEPLIEAADLLLYDVEEKGATLRISIDGLNGVPFGDLEKLAREISLVLDEADPSGSSYLLEVSTPGVERTLRSQAHFAAAVGEVITAKTLPGADGRKRFRGELVSADEHNITIADDEHGHIDVAILDVESARTIFVWGPTPKPGKAPSDSNRSQRRAS